MDPDSRLQCPQCPATFRRIEHLRRHLASHGDERPYQCYFCTASFKRRDALKRHWKSCRFYVDTGIDLLDVFEPPQGLKARRACDRCARLKKACTFDHPCTPCRAKNESCSYARLGLPFVRSHPDVSSIFNGSSPSNLGCDASPLSPGLLSSSHEGSLLNLDVLSADAFRPSLGASPRAVFTNIGGDRAGTLVYLSRVTTVTGLSNSFECHLYWQQHEMSDCVSSWSLCAADNPWDEPLIWQSATPCDTTASSLGLMDWAGDPLLHQTLAIVDQLSSTRDPSSTAGHQSVPVTSGRSQFLENLCIRFFSPPNIRRFLDLFWRVWYPHCPIVHRASFEATDTPATLLATMLVIGACVSSSEADKQTAKLWFDRLEEIAFGPELVSSVQYAGRAKERLDCLQTMYFACLIQTWEGSNVAKRRIRQSRFSTLLTIARGFDMSSSTHQALPLASGIAAEPWWRCFILQESIIRTLNFIFLLDAAFTIFYNSPPKMVISELQMDLICPEECFQAGSAETCLSYCLGRRARVAPALSSWQGRGQGRVGARSSTRPTTTLSLRIAVRRICQAGEMSLEAQSALAEMGILNLFIIIAGL
ncbi:hypothetical protein BJX66DRAFT_344628 [Aspergillus keveii]|uniref:C2H2 type zinc finger domain protein n=1 Tax=Aspergillus keveii TaxID=714993 RepID=A0ABR4FKQ0_9EURO